MRIIPAIDIKDGKCTQLVQGKSGTEKFYGDPLDAALNWTKEGAELLHVIDLDAALGTGSNLKKVLEIKKSVGVQVQFGGGIRDLKKAEELLNLGIDRIILGTLAIDDYFNDFKILNGLKEEFGKERILVALDSTGGKVVIRGWQEKTKLKASDLVKEFEDLEFEDLVWGFLFTDVDVEGKMKGIEPDEVNRVVKSTNLPVIASGGISSIKDVEKLKEIGAWGVVVGKALYEKKIDFREALSVQ